MMRFISALAFALALALAAILLPVVQGGHIAHAANGGHTTQTVALRREDCTTNGGATVGTARFALSDQGGQPGGLEIDVALTAGLPRSSYSVSVLGTPCQMLFSGGTLTTDDRGRGDLSVHVPANVVPAGTSLRVQVVAPANADVLTSDPTSSM